MNGSGFVDLGPLPAAIQMFTTYAIGMHVAAPSPDAAKALIKHLTDLQAVAAKRK